jgi:hypothetical protein
MASSYPGALDTATQQPSPSATTEMDDAGYEHHTVHQNASEALIALETKLGVGATTAATASTNHVLVKQADGDTEWAAAPTSTPTAITVADTTDTTCSVALFEDATGDLAPKTDGGATYNAGTGVLTATGFAGPLTGNVTGNASGTSASTTGNAATATALATARDIGGVSFDGTAAITLPGVNSAGNQNTSGTAATVTGAAQTAITSVGTLTSLTVSGGLVAPLQINAQTGTTYTFVIGDAGKFITSSNSSAQTFTVPPNSSVPFVVGTQLLIQNLGTADCTLAEGSGVTIQSKDSKKKVDGQWAAATMVKSATDTWSLFGALA